MTLGEFISLAQKELREVGFESPLSEAHYLLSQLLGIERSRLVVCETETLSESDENKLQGALERRLNGEPLAYIVGFKDFFKYRFKVRPGVLIPRPETELIVEEALKRKPNFTSTFLDLGCGSGCIGLSLLKEWPKANLIAIDQSPIAAEVTRENAISMGLFDRSVVMEGSVEGFAEDLHKNLGADGVELVVANPPYIDRADTRVEPHVFRYEPHEALFADQDGLAAIWSWLGIVEAILKPNGVALFEIGTDQAELVDTKIVKMCPSLRVEQIIKDLSGRDRILIINRIR